MCATDASIPTSSRWQAISVAACWVGGHQITSVKSPTGKVTTLDAELFGIRLAISKATTTGCKDIIFTDNIPAAKKATDTSIHSGQEHSIAVSRLLRSQFTAYPGGNFWDCPSDAKWFIQASLHHDAVRTQYPVAEQMRISLDALSQRNSKTCLEEWIVEFSRGETRGRNFLTLDTEKRTEATPTYAKGGTWMSYLGHSISLYARATRAILNHAPIGEYRARFFPQKTCPCGQSDRRHILTDCPRFTKDRVSLPSPCIRRLHQIPHL